VQKGYGEVIDANSGRGFYLPDATLVAAGYHDGITPQLRVTYTLSKRGDREYISAISLVDDEGTSKAH
jgi:hypothetical protein